MTVIGNRMRVCLQVSCIIDLLPALCAKDCSLDSYSNIGVCALCIDLKMTGLINGCAKFSEFDMQQETLLFQA